MSHIFFLEATIFRLHITERIIGDAEGDTNFIVKIDLIDIPSLRIHRDNDDETLENYESCDDNCEKNLDYYAGRACHFIAKCRDIVNALKRKPLKIGIYRMNERFPVCHGIVPFSGCVCDLVSKAIEEPSPFEFRGNFNLIDPGGNPSGQISLGIVLLDLGKHVITPFALDRSSFVLKNPKGVEYKCGELKNLQNHVNTNYSPSTMDPHNCQVDYDRENFILDIAGISLAAGNLSRGKPEVKKIRQSLNEHLEQSDDEIKVKQRSSIVEEKKSRKN